MRTLTPSSARSAGLQPPPDHAWRRIRSASPYGCRPAAIVASHDRRSARSNLLMAPALAWLAALMVVPCALVLAIAFFRRGIYGGIDYTFTLENFALVFDPLYAGIFLRSARIAATATLLALLIGYPAAYAIAAAPRRLQPLLLFFAVLPFWSNYLIRTYAWIVLLNREGLITQFLRWFGYRGRAAVAALHRRRGDRRARLQLPALRHPRLLRLALAAQPGAERGLARSRRLRLHHLPPHHAAADRCPASPPARSSSSCSRSAISSRPRCSAAGASR